MTPILNHYFARINWSGAAAVNIDTLRALHLKHNCTIPFENLDVLLPREIQLDDQSLEEKHGFTVDELAHWGVTA
jgi:N-hydroxyarylamine O-acetyltransferase